MSLCEAGVKNEIAAASATAVLVALRNGGVYTFKTPNERKSNALFSESSEFSQSTGIGTVSFRLEGFSSAQFVTNDWMPGNRFVPEGLAGRYHVDLTAENELFLIAKSNLRVRSSRLHRLFAGT